jgi:hypothetical protein
MMALAIINANCLHMRIVFQRPRQAGGGILSTGEQHKGTVSLDHESRSFNSGRSLTPLWREVETTIAHQAKKGATKKGFPLRSGKPSLSLSKWSKPH